MTTGIPDFYSRIQSEILLNFTDLQDTPGLYDGSANKNVRVNAIEKELEFGGAYLDSGLDAAKGVGGRKGRVWWATDSEKLYYDNGTDWVEILRSEAVSRLASLVDHAHASLSGVSSDQHHAESHTHASHTAIGADDHHAQAHTLASHSTKAHTELTDVSKDQHHNEDHHARHELGGDDKPSVAGLSGLLADPQTPIAQSKFSAHKNGTNQTGVVTGTWTKVTFETEECDIGSKYDAPNSKWTPGVIGNAHVSAQATLANIVDQKLMSLDVYKNGNHYKRINLYASETSGQGAHISCDVLVDAVTDYFEVWFYHTAGDDRIIQGNAALTWFMGHMLV